MMSDTSVDLAKMFKAASRTLVENQTELNEADDFNHNHGDNMVEVFSLINKAMTAKKSASPADQLKYAGQLVAEKGSSGSAAAYAEGLSRAAQQFQGRQINAENAVELIATLMGSQTNQQQAGASAANLFGSLLGGSSQTQESTSGGDLLGSLIGGLMGGETDKSKPDSDGIDTGDLLNFGMQMYQAYQSSDKSSGEGGSFAGNLLDTLLSGSSMGSSSHRSQSGKLVADALLKAAGKYLSSRTKKQ